MSILTSLLEKIEKEKVKEQSAKTKLLDFEKMIADQARANGLQPRTYLEQLCKQSESFASSKLVKVLLGEKIDEGRVKDTLLDMEADASAMSKEEFIKAHGEKYGYIWDRVQAQERGDTNEMDVPTQKGRDAKRDVLTPKSMNKVKQGIKQAAKKQRRKMDKDAVDEQSFVKGMKMGSPGDTMSSQDKMKMLQAIKQKRIQHAKMSPGPAKDKLSGEILDMMANAKMLIDPMTKKVMQSVEEGRVKDYLMDLEDDATKMSKDEFVKKHGEGKANIWDKVNSPDYNDISDLMDGNEFAKKVTDLKAKGAKPGTKFKTSDGKEHTLEDLVEKMMLVRDQVAKAVADKVQDWAKGASIDQINKVLAMIKSGAKLKPEGPQSASIEENRASDSINMAKLKSAVGGETKLVSTLFSSAVQNNMDDPEFIDAASRMLNIPPQEVKAIIDSEVKEDRELGRVDKMVLAKLMKELDGYKSMVAGETDRDDKKMYKERLRDLESMIKNVTRGRPIDTALQDELSDMYDAVKGVKEDAITEEQFEQLAEKKDACYHKVKSRYKVWPSAYASGALVRCRKVGAKNWGNKSKK